ncbi:ArsR/SmtB family transcription factor [Rhizocola hellebori]|nr:helix-turn-helix domain-containing protein [Rhizocola hellebori]
MSLGDAERQAAQARVQLRALAHPMRLRILSLLTGAEMTAAEVSRELAMTHANASYHLRHLHAADIIEVAGEERIHGGIAKRYRYDLERDLARPDVPPPADAKPTRDHRLIYAALASELQRRGMLMRRRITNHLTDAELWVDPEQWAQIRNRISDASDALHRAAKPPRSPGTIRVNATIALFEMEPGR